MSADNEYFEYIENWYRTKNRKKEELIYNFTYFYFDKPAPVFFNRLFKNREIWNLYVEVFNDKKMILDGTTFEQSDDAAVGNCEDSANTDQPQKKNTISFKGYNFPSGEVSFQDVKFSNPDDCNLIVLFSCITFKSDVTIKIDADIELTFIRCHFSGYVRINESNITIICFDRSDFKRSLIFDGNSISNHVVLNESEFHEHLHIVNSVIRTNINLSYCKVKKDFYCDRNEHQSLIIEYSNLNSFHADTDAGYIRIFSTIFTDNSSILLNRRRSSDSNTICAILFSSVSFIKVRISYVRMFDSEIEEPSFTNINWNFKDCVFDKSKVNLNQIIDGDELYLNRSIFYDTIFDCGDYYFVNRNLDLSVNDIRGSGSSMRFNDVIFTKKFKFYSVSLDDLQFNSCEFRRKDLMLRCCFIDRIFHLSADLHSLDLRGSVFKGVMDITERCICSLKSVIDLRDTKIENAPFLHKLELEKSFTTEQKSKTAFSMAYLLVPIISILFFPFLLTILFYYSCKIISKIFQVFSKPVKTYHKLTTPKSDKNESLKLSVLVDHATKNKSRSLALKLHAEELRAKRWHTKDHGYGFMRSILDICMDGLSNYGQSIWRPSFGLFLIFVFFSWLYLPIATDQPAQIQQEMQSGLPVQHHDIACRNKSGQFLFIDLELCLSESLELSLNNSLSLLSMDKVVRDDVKDLWHTLRFDESNKIVTEANNQPVLDAERKRFISEVSAIQKLVSFLFLFLIGLGLRNLFRL